MFAFDPLEGWEAGPPLGWESSVPPGPDPGAAKSPAKEGVMKSPPKKGRGHSLFFQRPLESIPKYRKTYKHLSIPMDR